MLNKNKTILFLIIIILSTIVNGFLSLRHFSYEKKERLDREFFEATISTLSYRIIESSRLQVALSGQELEDLQDIIDTNGRKLAPSDTNPFVNSYVLVFNQNHCPACVEIALKLVSDLNLNNSRPIKVLGSFSNPAGYYLFIRANGLKPSDCYYVGEMSNPLFKSEEIPMLVFFGEDGVIEKACFLENRLPLEFYKYFIQ
jgi:hypothetical protein